MSYCGAITVYVTSGHTAALRAAVAGDLCDYYDDPAGDPDTIFLNYVQRLNTDALIEADPGAIWSAAAYADTADSSVLFMYSDHDLTRAAHLRDELVINADVIGNLDNGWAQARDHIEKWDRVRGLTDNEEEGATT